MTRRINSVAASPEGFTASANPFRSESGTCQPRDAVP
jgi:hypothetical protein